MLNASVLRFCKDSIDYTDTHHAPQEDLVQAGRYSQICIADMVVVWYVFGNVVMIYEMHSSKVSELRRYINALL